jgi:hypothetical protein
LEADDNKGNEEAAMVTVSISNDNNSFKIPLYYIFLEDTKYMTIFTR